MSLTNLTAYKVHLGYSGVDRDAQYSSFISAIDAAIKRACQSNIESASYTSYLDAPPRSELRLPQLPVMLSGLAVYYCPRAYGNPASFTADTALTIYENFLLDVDDDNPAQSKTGILRRIGTWWGSGQEYTNRSLASKITPDYKAVKVTFTAGLTVIPADLQAAANNAVTRMFELAPKGVPMTSESLSAYSYSAEGQSLANGIIRSPDIWNTVKFFAKTGGYFFG